MLPQELKAMGNDREVFFYEGIPHPVLCEKIKYFKDRHFTSRLLPKVKIKTLNIGTEKMPNKVQDTVSAVALMALTARAVQPVATTPAKTAPQEITQTAQSVLYESANPANPVEALGQKLLKLIDNLETIDQLTVERINTAMGVEMLEDPAIHGSYDYEGPLTDQWRYRLRYETAGYRGNRWLDAAIFWHSDSEKPAMTGACLEFEGFVSKLAARGYENRPNYPRDGESTVPISWSLFRPGSDDFDYFGKRTGGAGAVDVNISWPRNEFTSDSTENGGRKCITSITISNFAILP